MPSLPESRDGLIDALARHYGLPAAGVGLEGRDPFEVILVAALSASVDPKKAMAAADALRDAGLLDPAELAAADPSEVDTALALARIRLTPRTLAPIRKLAAWFASRCAEPDAWLDPAATPTEALREDLAAIRGVGPATADGILLALGRAAYPVDRATYRVFARHGWLDPSADYAEARSAVESVVPGDDAPATARLSTWMDRLGRDFCRATVARCDRCPLRPFLPDGGPFEPE